MSNIIPFHRPQPPIWAQVAGVFIGASLFVTILTAAALAAMAQEIAEMWEQE